MTSLFIEDIFIEFYNKVICLEIRIDSKDYSAVTNFAKIIFDKTRFTKNQSKLVLKILTKYQKNSLQIGLDYKLALENPTWKNDFRILDLTKKVYIDIDKNERIWICFKFPYIFKDTFDKEFYPRSNYQNFYDETSFYDNEEKVRKLNFENFNIIELYDLSIKHNFQIDDSFLEILGYVEEIWNNQEKILKKSKIFNEEVILINAEPDTQDFFIKNRKNLLNDILLAKSLGHPLIKEGKNHESLIEKIALNSENWFWTNQLEQLILESKEIDGKFVIILDRASEYFTWLQNFVGIALENNVPKEEIKVCFRENSPDEKNINGWIKENGLGGKVSEGKYLIFLHKPNKWLFNYIKDVKLILTNLIYTPSDQITRKFMEIHHSVIFISDSEPSVSKEKTIAYL